MTYAHIAVADIARDMAQAVYEEAAKDNKWYAAHRNRVKFVRELAPKLISHAREVLTEMLQKNTVSDFEKDQIMEILAADQGVPRGKGTSVFH